MISLFATITLILNLTYTPLFTNAQQDKPTTPIKPDGDLVAFDFQVLLQKTGQFVRDLSKDDLSVYQDGAKQEVSQLTYSNPQLSIVLLFDLSKSMKPNLKAILEQVAQALLQLAKEDEVAVMAFATRAKLIQGFTKDKDLAVGKINSLQDGISDIGKLTSMREGLYQAAAVLRTAANTDSRKCIIVLTDNLSDRKLGPSKEQVLQPLLQNNAVVCCVLIPNYIEVSVQDRQFEKVENPLTNAGEIQSFTSRTGGFFLRADKTDLASAIKQIMALQHMCYRLVYKSPIKGSAGAFHKVEVKVSGRVEKAMGKMLVKAKEGYYEY